MEFSFIVKALGRTVGSGKLPKKPAHQARDGGVVSKLFGVVEGIVTRQAQLVLKGLLVGEPQPRDILQVLFDRTLEIGNVVSLRYRNKAG